MEEDACAAAAEAQAPEVESPEPLPSVLGYPALHTPTDGQTDDSLMTAQEGSLPREGQPICG